MIEHIAIIMDGNARWAKSKNLPISFGHKKGSQVVETIVESFIKLGIKTLTLYAFSTENWKRPKSEIDILMNLLSNYLKSSFVKKMINHDVKFMFIGDITKLKEDIQNEIKSLVLKTQNNSSFVLNIAINYGARDEIVRAVNKILSKKLESIREEDFEKYLDTFGLGNPDLLIRTSGEMRISNFLLWQIAYSEIYFSDVYWPDFDEKELLKAIDSFYSRKRRFGAR